MPEDFGSYLKHERELRGIPLDEIAQTTKISLRFLRALEESRFEELPGEVFIKGFIRSYGQAIGSNVDELLAAYHESSSQRQVKVTPPPEEAPAPSAPQKLPSGFPAVAVMGFAAAVLVAAGVFYWISVQNGETTGPARQGQVATEPAVDNRLPGIEGESGPEFREMETPDPESGPMEEPPELAAPPVAPKPDPAATAPAPDPVVKNTVTVPEKDGTIKDLQDQSVPETIPPAAEPALGDSSLQLVIRVTENSWFNLRIDDFRDQDFILPPGGTKTIEASNAIVMTIGNRRATQLELNGQPLDLPESPDNVIRNLTVNAEQLN